MPVHWSKIMFVVNTSACDFGQQYLGNFIELVMLLVMLWFDKQMKCAKETIVGCVFSEGLLGQLFYFTLWCLFFADIWGPS